MAPGFFDDFESDQSLDRGGGGRRRHRMVSGRGQFRSRASGSVRSVPGKTPPRAGSATRMSRKTIMMGAFVGASDVDNGKTTLLTPIFDGTGIGDLTLTYTRWFSNRAPSPDDDQFRADVSTDGGSSWTNLETIDIGTDSWAAVAVDHEQRGHDDRSDAAAIRGRGSEPRHLRRGGARRHRRSLHRHRRSGVRHRAEAHSRSLPRARTRSRSRRRSRSSSRRPGRVSLELFDVNGRRIRTLLQGDRVAAGSHRARWDGCDASGRSVSPGIYFAKLVAPDGERSRKITVLH